MDTTPPIVWYQALPPPFVARRPQLYNDPQKSIEWLARRTEQTASPAAANVGLSPYPRADPVTRWREMAGHETNPFRGNIHTDYGNRYEDRVRNICRAMLHTERALGGAAAPAIVEWGMFRDRVRRHLGISPDGESVALRIVGTLDDGRAIDWTLGKLMVEIKTSRAHAYEAPRIPHMTQIQLQMHVMGRHWGILHYWSRDYTRAWLVRHDRWGFCLWMMRRLDLMHEHVVRDVPVTDANPWFAYRTRPVGARRYPGAPPATVADWLQQEWYDAAKRTGKPLRPPLTRADWAAELALLGMTDAEWTARYPDTAPRTGDAGMLATPPQPDAYQIYGYERPLRMRDIEFTDDRCVPDVPADNMDWYCDEFPSCAEWAEVARTQPPPAGVRMPRLFIDHVHAAPEHDEEPPVDERADDTPEEAAAYEARLAAMRAARAAETVAAAPPSIQSFFAAKQAPLSPPAESAALAASPPSPAKRTHATMNDTDSDSDATPPPSPRVKRVVIESDALVPPLLSPPGPARADVVDDIVEADTPRNKREHDADDATPPPSPRVKRRASPDVD